MTNDHISAIFWHQLFAPILQDTKKFNISPYSTVYCGHFEVLFVKIGRLCEDLSPQFFMKFWLWHQENLRKEIQIKCS